jgi:dTDP-4-dehydrorhamnose reductase
MKIAIVGSGGRLGAALMREYRRRFDVTGFDHSQLDLADLSQIHAKIDNLDFNVLINAAALTDVDLCEKKRDLAFAINAEAPRVLAEICRDKKAKLIHFSTDYVFDGEKREPYLEEDAARPMSAYGESKRAGEQNVPGVDRRNLIVRVSWVFGPDRPSFVDGIIKRAREEEHVNAVADKFSTPTYARDIAQMLPQFFMSDAVAGVADPGTAGPSWTGERGRSDNGHDYSGILHFANAGECSWQEYAQFALDCCRSLGIPLKAKTVGAIKLADMKSWVARRPVYSVLSTEKFFSLTGTTPRNWRDAVAEHVREHYAGPT